LSFFEPEKGLFELLRAKAKTIALFMLKKLIKGSKRLKKAQNGSKKLKTAQKSSKSLSLPTPV
jgi:hypothetical protein